MQVGVSGEGATALPPGRRGGNFPGVCWRASNPWTATDRTH
jgi:hypothetical protein